MKTSLNLINSMNLALVKREFFFICKRSKLNIALLKLLLNEGLILSFYQLNLRENALCVFLKYWNKKPVITKVLWIKQKNTTCIDFTKLLGDLQSNDLFVISTNAGGLFLLNKKSTDNLNWYNRIGGNVLFKIIV